MIPIAERYKLSSRADRRLYNFFNTAAALLLLAAAILTVWTALIRSDMLRQRYLDFQLFLEDLQLYIISLDSKWLIIIAILLMFAVKAYFGVVPMNALFVISGMVFSMPAAVLINVAGLLVLMSLKYYNGTHRGAGSAEYLFKKFPAIEDVFENDEKRSSRLLVVFRLVPNFPFSMVSRLYGSVGFPFEKFIFLTLLGYTPRLLSYSFLGNKVFDPFSAGFFTPIIVLLVVSGFSMLVLNTLIYSIKEK